MPLLDHMLNTQDVAIQRNGAYLDGGDRSKITIHIGLRAKVQNASALSQEGRVRGASNETIFWMRHITAKGEKLDIKEGDEITWPDWQGDRQVSTVRLVLPIYDGFGGRLDHLLVEAIG